MKDSNVYQDRIKKDAVSSLFFFYFAWSRGIR